MADEVDITADLVDGTDGALGDVANAAAVVGGARQGEVDDAAPASKQAGVVHTNEVTQPIKPAETSLRDQLSSAFKPAEEKPAEQAQAPANVPALTKDSEGRYRQADGTFASTEQVTAFEAAKAAPAQNITQEQAPAYMSRMTPLEREQYNALPAETREFIGRTMEAVDSQAARFGEYGVLEQSLIGPRREAWAANGMTPAVALNQLFALSDFATQNPKDFVLWFADQQKIDLDAALDERDALLQNVDPQVRALQSQVQQLQQHVNQSQSGQVHAQEQANLQTVEAFAQEKDGAGKPLRPYFTDVATTLAAQVQALRIAHPNMPAPDLLQKAYEAACWSNPQVRAKMQEEVQAQQREEAARRTQQARLAGSSVNGAPAGAVPNATRASDNNLTLRDEIAANFKELSAG